jgi:hypothetical protein
MRMHLASMNLTSVLTHVKKIHFYTTIFRLNEIYVILNDKHFVKLMVIDSTISW